ncbi:MAG: DUF2953 domain-containing protein [Actinobacteria bacterium]|nr:DUF2953 domain-containing protein [Actinomycetota bacterium]
MFLYLLAGLSFLVALIALLPVELRIRYGREGEEDLLRLGLSVWPGIRFEFRLVMIDFRSSLLWSVLSFRGEFKRGSRRSGFAERKKYSAREFVNALRQFIELKDIFKTVRPSLNYLAGSIELARLTWKTVLGAGDPFYTGLAAGAAWSLKGFIITALCSQLRVSGKPSFFVEPCFTRRILTVTLDCILKIRTGHIIFTGVRMMAALIFSGKAGRIIKMLIKPGRRYGYARTSH